MKPSRFKIGEVFAATPPDSPVEDIFFVAGKRREGDVMVYSLVSRIEGEEILSQQDVDQWASVTRYPDYRWPSKLATLFPEGTALDPAHTTATTPHTRDFHVKWGILEEPLHGGFFDAPVKNLLDPEVRVPDEDWEAIYEVLAEWVSLGGGALHIVAKGTLEQVGGRTEAALSQFTITVLEGKEAFDGPLEETVA